jgi:hypothetical protein
MRRALFLVGIALVLAGMFFALQGAGIIPWPPESFMVGQQAWITKGSGLALAGLVLIFLSRTI